METDERKSEEEKVILKEKEKQNNIVKCTFTVYISKDVVEKIRDAIYWTPGMTISKFGEEALISALNRLEEIRGVPTEERPSDRI